MLKKTDWTIVFDIDECLLSAAELKNRKITDRTLAKACKEIVNPMYQCSELVLGEDDIWIAVKRPGLDRFLNFAEKYFKQIIVWSAAREDYVEAAVKFLFADHVRPTAIFSRNHVTYVNKDDYYKPLSKITTMEPGMIDYSKTLFLDDKKDNFRDFPDNGITIPKFNPHPEKAFTTEDDMLLRLVDWLMLPEVYGANDVRKLNKKHIFDKPYSGKYDSLMGYERRFLFTPKKKL